MRGCRALDQFKPPPAIGAINMAGMAHIQEHTRMPERAIAAITGDARLLSFDDFGRLHRALS